MPWIMKTDLNNFVFIEPNDFLKIIKGLVIHVLPLNG